MKLIIWDYDGTAADTHGLNFEATKLQAKACGVTLPCNNVKELIRLASPDIHEHYANLGFKEEDYVKCEKIYAEFMRQHKAPIFPGIPQAFDHFSKGNLQCLVTSNYEDIVRFSMEGLMDYFPFMIDHDYGGKTKPHPEPLQLAMELTGFDPKDVILIGNMPQDIIAGRAANIGMIIGATWDENNDLEEKLSAQNPHKIFSRTEQLLTI